MIKITKQSWINFKNTDVKKFYKQNLQGKLITNPVLGKIIFSQKGLGETIHRVKRKYHPFICVLRELVETGQCDGVLEDLYYPRNDRIVGFYHIKNSIKLAHIIFDVDVLIALDQHGNKYHMFKKDPQGNLGEGLTSQRGPSGSNYNITQNSEFVKGECFNIGDCIKIVVRDTNIMESNNEPIKEQLVYHGTNTQFQQFDKSFMDRMDYGYGFYFTTDKSYAKDYGKYLLTCEIPDDKYFMDFKLSWDYNEYIADCLINLLMSIQDTDKRIKLQNVMFRDYCNDGFWILETLSKIFNGQQNACKELVKFGIKGLYSLEGNCYVVFDNKDIKIIKTEMNESCKTRCQIINEKYTKYFNEEAAMLKAPQDTFEQFYNYCIKNPKLQQKIYYECFNGHIRIPSDIINHTWKKHKTTCEQWLDALSNLTNIQEASKSKDKTLGRPTFLCRILGYKDFGIAMADCPDYLYIMTLFVDHINSINNWIQTGSIRRPASQLPAPVSNTDSVTHDGFEPNNIIQYIIEKIKG